MSSLGLLQVQIGANTTGLTAGLRGAQGQLAMFNKQVTASMTRMAASTQAIGRSITARISLPLALVGGGVLKMSADFEQGMNKVEALTGSTGKALADLNDQAKSLGLTTKFSAKQASDAMGFLAMAGFEANEIMGAMPHTLNLAAAANIDLGRAADITTNILTGFGIEIEGLAKANDVLVKTFTSANVDMEMLGQSMKFVAPVAKAAGIAFSETAAAIGLLGNAGIQGSMAGTQLRMSMIKFLKPTSEGQKAIDRLGISTKDATGNMLSMTEIIRQLEVSGASLTDMADIVGVRAVGALAALVSQGSDELIRFQAELEDSAGTAARIATTQLKGLSGAFTILKSAIVGTAIEMGDSGALGIFTKWIKSLTVFVRSLADASAATMRMATAIGAVLIAAGPLVLIFGKLIGLYAWVITGTLKLATGLLILAIRFAIAAVAAHGFMMKLIALAAKGVVVAALAMKRLIFQMALMVPYLFTMPWLVLTTAVSGLASSMKVLAVTGVRALVKGFALLAASILMTVAPLFLLAAALVAGFEIIKAVGGSWKWLTDVFRGVANFFGEFVSFFTNEQANLSEFTKTTIKVIANAWLGLKFAWNAVKVGIQSVVQGILTGLEKLVGGFAWVAERLGLDVANNLRAAEKALGGWESAIQDVKEENLKTMQSIENSMSNAPEALKRDVQKFMAVIKDVPGNVVDTMNSMFPGLMVALKGGWESLQAWLDGRTLQMDVMVNMPDPSGMSSGVEAMLPEDRAAREQVATQRQFDRGQLIDGDLGNAAVAQFEQEQEFIAKRKALHDFFNMERVTSEQMTADQIAEIHFGFQAQLAESWEEWRGAFVESSTLMADALINIWDTVWQGFANGFAQMITSGKKMKDVLSGIWKSLVNTMIKWLFTWLKNYIFAKSAEAAIDKVAVGEKVTAKGVEVAANSAAAAPHPFLIPAWVAIGLGALAAGLIAGKAMGSSHAGVSEIPGALGQESSYVLQAGQRTLAVDTNEDLKEDLEARKDEREGGAIGGTMVLVLEDGTELLGYIDRKVRSGELPLVRKEDR